MKQAYLSAFVLLFTTALLSAQPVFRGTPRPSSSEALSQRFSEYHLFRVDASALSRYARNEPGAFQLELRLGNTYQWAMELQGEDLRSDDYRLVSVTPRGEQVLPRTENKTFKGRALAPQGGEVRLTLDDNFIYGFVEMDGETYYIEPAWPFAPELEKDTYLAYPASGVINTGNYTCAWEEEARPGVHELPAPEAGRFVLACYRVDIALAADFTMVQRFGSASGAESFMLGVLNNVQSNFDNEFAHQILFSIATLYVSACANCDPEFVNATSLGGLLDNFTSWGNNGNLGANYDVASLWTDRDFPGSAIGVAWVGGLCTNARYNVLQNFTINASLLRVLQAHELGHNFNAGHDAQGTNFIMSPSVNNTNTWSTLSRASINSFINAVSGVPGCFGDCNITIDPPTAGLTASINSGCVPLTVNFSDLSSGQVDDYSWQFPGGTPATSTSPNPTVTYNTAGTFDVQLTVSNLAGSNTVTLQDYIVVEDYPNPQFLFSVSSLSVQFDNISTNAQNYEWDFGDGNTTVGVSPVHTYANDGIYPVTLTAYNQCGPATFTEYILVEMPLQAGFSADNQTVCVGQGVTFTDQTSGNPVQWEWDFEGGSPASSTDAGPVVTYNTPGTYDVFLTATNVVGTFSDFAQPDYIQVLPNPQAAFTYNFSPGGLAVQFNNFSSNADSWFWDFGDGNTSTEENPSHTYAAEGNYLITFTASSSCGSDVQVDEIVLATPPNAAFSANVLSGCAPLTVQFTNESSDNSTTFEWFFQGGTPSTSTLPDPVVSFNTGGTYTVTLVSGNIAGSDTTTQSLSIEGGAQSAFTINYTVGDTEASFINQSSDADSILWILHAGATSMEDSISYDFGADGVYPVTLVAFSDCGNDTLIQNITVITAPTADFSLDATAGCVPFTVQPNDQSSDNTTSWEWSAPGAVPETSTEQSPGFSYDTPGTYTITLVAGNTAGTNTHSVTVTVGDIPNADFSASVTLGQTALSLTNNTTDADSYAWDFGDGNTSTEPQPAHSYDQDGTYTVQLIASNECGNDTTTQEVTVTTAPTANFSLGATTGCVPFTVQASDQSSDNTTEWTWSAPGASPETSDEQNPSFTYTAPGNYTITLVAGNAAGSSMHSITVTVGDTPEAAFSASVTLGQTNLSLTNNSTGANTYAWDFGDGNTSTEPQPPHSYAQDGTYTVQLIATNECGNDTTTQDVTVITAPTAEFSIDATAGCAPFTVQASDQSSDNTTSWAWSAPGATPETSDQQNPSFTYSAPGAYTITLEAGNAAGANLYSIEVFINSGPEPGFTAQVNGLEAQFSNTSANSLSYEWDFGDGNSSDAATPVHSYNAPGDYIVTLTATNECGTATTTDTITLDLAAPLANFTVSGNEGCAPLTATFENNSENAESYSWSFPGGIPSSSTEANPTVTYETPGIYSVTLMAINAAGSGAQTRQDIIVVGGPPLGSFEYATNEATVAFTNTTENADSYLWMFGDGNTSTSSEPEHTYAQGGDYTVMLLATNECGTDTAEQVVTLTGSAPAPNLSASVGSGCAPLSVSFEDGVEGTVNSWQWSFPGGTPDSSTEPNPTVVYEQAGVYDVSLIVGNAFGESSQEEIALVTVIGLPQASFDYDIQELALSLTNASTGEGLSYNWDFGDGNTSEEENPQHTYSEPGEYTVVLTVTNACGESVAEEAVVAFVTGVWDESWLEELSLFPNPNSGAFTIRLQGQPAGRLQLSLLNVVGQRIFRLDDSFHTGYWQQTLELEQLPAGAYVLEIQAGEQRAYRKVIVE